MLQKPININFVGLILLIGLFSCNGGLVIDEDSLETNFYPVKLGNSWTYRMDSITYDDLGMTIRNTSSFLRETLVDHLVNTSGDSIFILEIAKRKDSLSEWLVTDLWTLSQTEKYLKRKEENLNFVKLVFPPLIGTSWVGNQFDENTEVMIAGDNIKMYENWDYRILNRINKISVEGEEYQDVLQIQQADDENLIKRRYSIEHYDENLGLILREMIILDIVCSTDCDEELPWEEKGDQGFILTQTLVDYQL